MDYRLRSLRLLNHHSIGSNQFCWIGFLRLHFHVDPSKRNYFMWQLFQKWNFMKKLNTFWINSNSYVHKSVHVNDIEIQFNIWCVIQRTIAIDPQKTSMLKYLEWNKWSYFEVKFCMPCIVVYVLSCELYFFKFLSLSLNILMSIPYFQFGMSNYSIRNNQWL